MSAVNTQQRVPQRVAVAYFAERFVAMSVLLLQSPTDKKRLQAILLVLQQNRPALAHYEDHFAKHALPLPNTVVDECAIAIKPMSRLACARLALKCTQVGYALTRLLSLALTTEAQHAFREKLKASGLTATQPSVPQTPPPSLPEKKSMN